MAHLKKVRALGLSSGGLDSILAALVLQKQGIEVCWVSFETPFFPAEKAEKAAKFTKIDLIKKNITDIYLKMLKNPPGGYGKNMNPCRDCHAMMFNLAGKVMETMGFDFLFSGEVSGQRPLSQTKSALRYVEKRSGYDGYILRPLSALHLPETIPEKEGKVNREKLLNFSGRSRKPQIKLAREFEITDYPTPGGGCLLTDKSYSERLKDLLRHQDNFTHEDLHLLKYGRCLRLNRGTKVIIGRNKLNNENIMKYYLPKEDTLITTKKIPGPLLIMKNGTREDVFKAAAICAGYSKALKDAMVDVEITNINGTESVMVKGCHPSSIKKLMI